MAIKRRVFLSGMASGSAVISMPGFLAGCAETRIVQPQAAMPGNPFLDWFGIDQDMISRVMSELTSNGADAADLYFQHKRSNSLNLEDGIVSKASSSIDQGAGLRVVVGDQTGYAYTEDLNLDSLRAAARTAAAIANGSRRVAPQQFNPGSMGDLYTTTVPWADVGVDRKLPILKMVEAKARALDDAIKKVEVSWSDIDERIMIATLDGNLITDRRPMAQLTVRITAEKNNEVQSGTANVSARQGISWYTQDRLDEVTKKAVHRTMILFDARRPPAGEMPVILAAGASGILLHEAIGHGMEADFNRKGTSIYSDLLGKKVAEPFVNIIDQATISGQRGALNYDDEGNETQRTTLVKNGVLTSYLHDGISARQYKVKLTGSGRRQSYKYAPMPRMSCTFMEDGPHTYDEIVESVRFGIIAETFLNGQVRIGSGDYTFYIKNGWLVEDGKVTAPIRDVNIIGNGPESLTRITMVANDTVLDTGGWMCGKNGQRVPVSLGIPTVLVSKMTVGGEHA